MTRMRWSAALAATIAFVAAVGSPAHAFFAPAARFPAQMDGPPSLRPCAGEREGRLDDYMDAFVYLGPSPDRGLVGTIPLTAAQQRELARREAINADAQRTMRARLGGRDRWFAAHPNDLAPRPAPAERREH